MAASLIWRSSILALILLFTTGVLRAGSLNVGLEIGALAKEIKELVIYMLENSRRDEVKRIKTSAASVSQRMSRLAAMKESFASFLDKKTISIHDLSLPEQAVADRELRAIDRELSELERDLRRMDPEWSSKHSELYNRLFRIGHGKGLTWAAKFGPHGSGQYADDFADWMRQEALQLKGAAAEIESAVGSTATPMRKE